MQVKRNHGELQRCARRSLFWCGLTLCLSPLVGGWLVDSCPVHIRDPGAAACVSLWRRAKPEPQILVLGSSRLGSFVRTRELNTLSKDLLGDDFTPIFNASVICGEPITVQFITRRLLVSRAPPKLVLLETSPDLLARNNRYFVFVITQQLTAGDLPRYIPDILRSEAAVSRLISSRVTPFFRHRNHLLGWTNELVSGGRKIPSLPSKAVEAHSFQFVRDRGKDDPVPLAKRMQIGAARFRSYLRNYQIAGATSAALESTVAMLRAHGCMVILVAPPVSSAQRALLTGDAQTQFDTFLQRLTISYGCEVANYSNRLPDHMFVDNHHANDAGSIKFTEWLAAETLAPAWRKVVNPRAD